MSQPPATARSVSPNVSSLAPSVSLSLFMRRSDDVNVSMSIGSNDRSNWRE